MRKFFKWIEKIILVLLLFILMFVIYSRFIRKDYITKIFNTGFLVVITESMEPEIKSGDFIMISDKERYKVGDIVTYVDEEDMLVTHRIIEMDQNTFIAKGDNNNISDERVSTNRILGKVIYKSTILGFFVYYILKILVCIYVIYLLILEIISLFKKDNKELKRIKLAKDKKGLRYVKNK